MDKAQLIHDLKAEAQTLKEVAAVSVDPHLIAKYVALSSEAVQEAFADRILAGWEHVATDTTPLVWNQRFLVAYKFKKKGALLADQAEQDTFAVTFFSREVTRATAADAPVTSGNVPLATLLGTQADQVITPATSRARQDAETAEYFARTLPEMQTRVTPDPHACQVEHYYSTASRCNIDTVTGTPIPGNENNAMYDHKTDNVFDGPVQDSRTVWTPDKP